jgi:hypothetical protein
MKNNEQLSMTNEKVKEKRAELGNLACCQHDLNEQKEKNMKKNKGVFFGIAVLILTAFFTLAGCPTTKKAAKTAPDEVGEAAVDETTEAAKDETRKAVREGIDSIFGR